MRHGRLMSHMEAKNGGSAPGQKLAGARIVAFARAAAGMHVACAAQALRPARGVAEPARDGEETGRGSAMLREGVVSQGLLEAAWDALGVGQAPDGLCGEEGE